MLEHWSEILSVLFKISVRMKPISVVHSQRLRCAMWHIQVVFTRWTTMSSRGSTLAASMISPVEKVVTGILWISVRAVITSSYCLTWSEKCSSFLCVSSALSYTLRTWSPMRSKSPIM